MTSDAQGEDELVQLRQELQEQAKEDNVRIHFAERQDEIGVQSPEMNATGLRLWLENNGAVVVAEAENGYLTAVPKGSGADSTPVSETMTVAELLALCGSENHSAGGKTLADLQAGLGEAHPVVAGQLVEHLRRSLDESTGKNRGTASGSEHPDWHESLDRAKDRSLKEGYDVE